MGDSEFERVLVPTLILKSNGGNRPSALIVLLTLLGRMTGAESFEGLPPPDSCRYRKNVYDLGQPRLTKPAGLNDVQISPR